MELNAGGSTADSFTGVAISSYTVDAAKGNWQYSTDGGSNWTTLHHDFRYVEIAVVGGIVAIAAYWVLRLRRTAR